jgi:hypothetical protein
MPDHAPLVEKEADTLQGREVRHDLARPPLSRDELLSIARSILEMANLSGLEPEEESDIPFTPAREDRPVAQEHPFSYPRGWVVACLAAGPGPCRRAALAFEEEPEERRGRGTEDDGMGWPIRFVVDLEFQRLGELRLTAVASGRRLNVSVAGVPEPLRPGLLAVWTLALDGLDIAGGLAFVDAEPDRASFYDDSEYGDPDLGELV